MSNEDNTPEFSAPTDVTKVTVVSEDDRPTPGGGGEACLVVFYGKNLGRRYFMRRADQIIGRSDSASIYIDQESVSRQHAKLVTGEGKTRIEDLNSTNGTFVNDERVGSLDLRDGDLVRIGQTIFKYLSGSNIESKYHEEIYRLTTIDGLTKTFNKRYFVETFERELNRAQRYKRDLALVLFDIDHFKSINDTYGHLAGDQVLRDLAALVMENIRREDILARYGGEEFAAVLPEIDKQGAVGVCEKIRAMVESQRFVFNNRIIPVTISLGVYTLAPDSRETPDEFIAKADENLYKAKDLGRNRVIA